MSGPSMHGVVWLGGGAGVEGGADLAGGCGLLSVPPLQGVGGEREVVVGAVPLPHHGFF
jgi:hypothetical protein